MNYVEGADAEDALRGDQQRVICTTPLWEFGNAQTLYLSPPRWKRIPKEAGARRSNLTDRGLLSRKFPRSNTGMHDLVMGYIDVTVSCIVYPPKPI